MSEAERRLHLLERQRQERVRSGREIASFLVGLPKALPMSMA